MTRIKDSHYAIGVMLESRATDLLRKGSLEFATQNFNPRGIFGRVIMLTPYKSDLEIAPTISRYGLEIRYHGGRIGRPFLLPINCFNKSVALIRCYEAVGRRRARQSFALSDLPEQHDPIFEALLRNEPMHLTQLLSDPNYLESQKT